MARERRRTSSWTLTFHCLVSHAEAEGRADERSGPERVTISARRVDMGAVAAGAIGGGLGLSHSQGTGARAIYGWDKWRLIMIEVAPGSNMRTRRRREAN